MILSDTKHCLSKEQTTERITSFVFSNGSTYTFIISFTINLNFFPEVSQATNVKSANVFYTTCCESHTAAASFSCKYHVPTPAMFLRTNMHNQEKPDRLWDVSSARFDRQMLTEVISF